MKSLVKSIVTLSVTAILTVSASFNCFADEQAQTALTTQEVNTLLANQIKQNQQTLINQLDFVAPKIKLEQLNTSPVQLVYVKSPVAIRTINKPQ